MSSRGRQIFVRLLTLSSLLVAPVVITKCVEWQIESPNWLASEVGYSLPDNARIVATSARLWSLADGTNYEWSVISPNALKPWAKSFAVRQEQEGWYRADTTLPDGRHETSYIDIHQDGLCMRISTFRP